MSINQQQFEQLNEMGISLWQHRSADTQHNGAQHNDAQHQLDTYLNIDLNDLAKQQLFNDILLATGRTIGEISLREDHLDLGLFNWYFTEDPSQAEIKWLEQQLITPAIDKIAKSPTLKQQLWQVLSEQAQ